MLQSAGGEASASSDDDWESIADRAPDEVFSSQNDERLSKLADRAPDEVFPSQNDERISKLSLNDTEFQTPKRCGRGAFLYRKNGLYSDQQPNLSNNADPDGEIDDEHSEENAEEKAEKGNSLEACNSIHCTFTVRVLKENDVLLCSISTRDVEPPIPRPKTSTRTAQRLIAQGMGMKLPETSPGSSEFRKQTGRSQKEPHSYKANIKR